MSVRNTEVRIGTTTFYILPMDPFKQLELFGDLQREVLPSVGGLVNVVLDKNESESRADAAAMAAMRDLSEKLGGAKLKQWAERLLVADYVSYQRENDSRPSKLDRAGMGLAFDDFSQVLELMYHVGRVNFAGPLARWANLSGLAQRMMARLSSADSAPTSQAS